MLKFLVLAFLAYLVNDWYKPARAPAKPAPLERKRPERSPVTVEGEVVMEKDGSELAPVAGSNPEDPDPEAGGAVLPVPLPEEEEVAEPRLYSHKGIWRVVPMVRGEESFVRAQQVDPKGQPIGKPLDYADLATAERALLAGKPVTKEKRGRVVRLKRPCATRVGTPETLASYMQFLHRQQQRRERNQAAA